MIDINQLAFDAQGLIPAIVQDYYTKQVLTLAYMNRESLEISLREGYTCFWSRSRQELWRKGASSGHTQRIINITADCDCDALVVEVVKSGPACHTGMESCFSSPLFQSDQQHAFSLNGLYGLIAKRKRELPSGSYTTYLFEKGLDKILKKVGEESTEVIIGALNGQKSGNNCEAVYEIADLVYHLLVLMVQQGIPLSDVVDELARRNILDKKIKQETLGGEA